ncbi:MAG: poly-gamma-glutamate biosynthesis protein PgsC/CapC [Polyangiaceae bacterium]|nr:poly-gamma-glutamate biosynthesis protein PgsC/CapC [Polyangiaceae bacterium]
MCAGSLGILLRIFPQSGLDTSVITPVLLGVLLSWFLTETLGWVFAGLVVPGYLAAVFLVEPLSGVINVVEAALSYLIARFIGEYLPKAHLSSRVFGRERFLLVVVVSILVRLVLEGFVFRRMFPQSNWAFSIGLVVVPLAAHSVWKVGLLRGAVQKGLPTLVVYLMLRFVLMPHTNLSLGGFALANENMVSSFLEAPKAYIILLTGALLAAFANLKYGWDFNGILVPALLGLVIIEPTRFMATFAETLALVAIVSALLRFTPLGRANIEGPRRIVLFFVVDYVLRFAVAGTLGKFLAGNDIVELMGFGYLISTLLAVKITQKRSIPLVLIPTLTISGLGFALGTLVGTFAEYVWPTPVAFASARNKEEGRAPKGAPQAAFWIGAQALLHGNHTRPMLGTNAHDISKIADGVLNGNRDAGSALGLVAEEVQPDTFLIHESATLPNERRGLSAVMLRRGSALDFVVVVPRPLKDPGAAAFAGWLVEQGLAKIAVISQLDNDVPVSDSRSRVGELASVLANGREVLSLEVVAEDPQPASNPSAMRAPDALKSVLVKTPLRFRLSPLDGGMFKLEVGSKGLGALLSEKPESGDLASSVAISLLLEDVPKQR